VNVLYHYFRLRVTRIVTNLQCLQKYFLKEKNYLHKDELYNDLHTNLLFFLNSKIVI